MTRSYSRSNLEMRPVKIIKDVNENAAGSVIVEFGKTRVYCTATLEKNVPQWLQGQQRGWVTAEYSLLPGSTHTRTKRERDKVGGRTHEIQRLIARSLRAVVDLGKISEKSIFVDCDVLQADGGTRTASITGGYVALALALKKLGLKDALTGQVAAVSVGMKDSKALVDLDYAEDSSSDVDMNFVMLGDGRFVEVQGTAEQGAFSREQMNLMTDGAVGALGNLLKIQKEVLGF